MNRQRRSIHNGAVRAFEDAGQHYIELLVTRYNVVDEYKTVWLPGVFDRALQERPPTLAWSHDWSDPIGRAVYSEDSPDGPVVRFRLDDFDAVPRARQAFAQVQSGTIDDCSVGFSHLTSRRPTPEDLTKFPGATEMMEDADLDEVSLVLRGAVPGAKVLAMRSPQVISAEAAGQIMTRLIAGEIDLHEALGLVKEGAVEEADDEEKPKEPGTEAEPPEEQTNEDEPEKELVTASDEDATDYDAEIEEALALVGRFG